METWFITGASRGFGHACARAALERGDRVAATARDASTLDDLVGEFGDAVLPLRLDVTDRAAAFTAVDRAHDHFGALAVAQFWAAALRVDVAPGASPARAELVPDAAPGLPRLVFRQVPEGRALRTPLHLQLTTGDLDAESRGLLGLGARRLGSVTDHGRRTVTLVDPEGNAFEPTAA